MAWCWIVAGLMYQACQDRPHHKPGKVAPGNGDFLMKVEHPAGALPNDHAVWPAPGNMGFISNAIGEDGAPLPCLLIGATAKKGSTHAIRPLAAAQWRTGEKTSTCIIAVSAEEGDRVAVDFMDLRLRRDHLRQAMELWLRYAYMPSQAEWLGLQNEVYAFEEVLRSMQRLEQ